MEDKETKELAKKLGRRGGTKTLQKHGADHFKRISSLGVAARRKKKSEAILSVDNQALDC